MDIKSKVLGLAGAASVLVWLVQFTACTSDNTSDGSAGTPGTGAGGSASGAGGSGTAGSTPGSGGSAAGTVGSGGASGGSAGTTGSTVACANPTVIPMAKPSIADFEKYDGATDFQKWSFSFGGDAANGVLAGTFSYGDRTTGFPETSELSAGHSSMYAMRIADTDAARAAGASGLYGGGVGLWLSTCVSATAFTGISFWVRGNSPSPTATFTMSMKETLSSTPAKAGDNVGTCTGTSTTCIHPTYAFAVTDAWTQIQAPWSGFKAGDAAGTPVMPDGRNIVQFQFGVGLNFVPTVDGGTTYIAVPAAYELAVDDMAFY